MTLQERINNLLIESGKSQSDLAKAIGVSRTTVSDWRSGKITTINSENAFKVGRYFNVNPEWLATGNYAKQLNKDAALTNLSKIESNAECLGSFDLWDESTPLRDDEIALPFFKEVQLSAGSGICEVQENHGRKLRFAKSTLRAHNIIPECAACVTVSGNSMAPVLPDGSTIGIDTSDTAITDGEMYAINHCGHLRVKLLYKMPGGLIRLRSYNSDEWPDEYINPLDIKVIGWVFWQSIIRNRKR